MSLPKSTPCTHPDHADNNEDCADNTAVACSPYCECCLDPFSVHTNKMQARINELESEVTRLQEESQRRKLGMARGAMYEAMFILKESLDQTMEDELKEPEETT